MSFYLSKKEMFRTQENYSASKSQYLLATGDLDPTLAPPVNAFISLPSHKLVVSVTDDATLTFDLPVKDAQFLISSVGCLKAGNAGGAGNGDNVVLQHVDSAGVANTIAELDPAGATPFDTLVDGQFVMYDKWSQSPQIFVSGDSLRISKVRPAGADVGCVLYLDVCFV